MKNDKEKPSTAKRENLGFDAFVRAAMSTGKPPAGAAAKVAREKPKGKKRKGGK